MQKCSSVLTRRTSSTVLQEGGLTHKLPVQGMRPTHTGPTYEPEGSKRQAQTLKLAGQCRGDKNQKNTHTIKKTKTQQKIKNQKTSLKTKTHKKIMAVVLAAVLLVLRLPSAEGMKTARQGGSNDEKEAAPADTPGPANYITRGLTLKGDLDQIRLMFATDQLQDLETLHKLITSNKFSKKILDEVWGKFEIFYPDGFCKCGSQEHHNLTEDQFDEEADEAKRAGNEFTCKWTSHAQRTWFDFLLKKVEKNHGKLLDTKLLKEGAMGSAFKITLQNGKSYCLKLPKKFQRKNLERQHGGICHGERIPRASSR